MASRPSPRIDRLGRLLREIRAGRAPDRKTLAARLRCSVRTVQRLLHDLERCADVKIVFDPSRGGYRIEGGAASLPTAAIESILTDLCVVRGLLGAFPRSGLERGLETHIEELKKGLPREQRPRFERLLAHVSARPPPARPPAPGSVALLACALRDGRAVRLRYASSRDSEGGVRVLWPVHLTCLVGEWYLFAVRTDRSRERPRQYSLARMSDVEILSENAQEADDDVLKRFKKRFRRFVPGDPQARSTWLRVRFTAAAAPWIEERVWHEQQAVRRGSDGSLLLSFPVPSLFEAFQWVLRWGPEVEVLEPKELRAAVAEAARRTARLYEPPPLPMDDPRRGLPPGLFA